MIKVNVFIDGVETSIDRDLVPKDANSREVDYILPSPTVAGEYIVDTARQSAEDLKVATEKWKQEVRQPAVDAIEVTHNNVIYQGNEDAQRRINNAITGLKALDNSDPTNAPHTIDWVAKDNITHPLTASELELILIDAGMQMSALWNVGRPV